MRPTCYRKIKIVNIIDLNKIIILTISRSINIIIFIVIGSFKYDFTCMIPITDPIKLKIIITNDKKDSIVKSLLSKLNDDSDVIKYMTIVNVVSIKNKLFLVLDCLIFKISPPI